MDIASWVVRVCLALLVGVIGVKVIGDAVREYRAEALAEDEESGCERCPFEECLGPGECWREVEV